MAKFIRMIASSKLYRFIFFLVMAFLTHVISSFHTNDFWFILFIAFCIYPAFILIKLFVYGFIINPIRSLRNK